MRVGWWAGWQKLRLRIEFMIFDIELIMMSVGQFGNSFELLFQHP